jgi:outer membrane lipoprotein SlyB
MDRDDRREDHLTDDLDTTTTPVNTAGESHATTGGAAAAGAVTGGVIGLTGGPVGAVVGAVGGAIVGAAAERMMHSDDDDVEHTQATSSTVIADETAATSVNAADIRATDRRTHTTELSDIDDTER